MLYKMGMIAVGFLLSQMNRNLEMSISESTYVNHAMFNCGILMIVYSVMFYAVQVSDSKAKSRAPLALLTSPVTK